MILKPNFKVEFRGDFGKLIGFTQSSYSTTSKGEELPDITRSVDIIQIICSLASSNVDGTMSDVLYQFSTQNLYNSYPFSKKPTDIGELYGICNQTEVSRIRVYVTDNLGRPIDLNRQKVSLTLSIRECD